MITVAVLHPSPGSDMALARWGAVSHYTCNSSWPSPWALSELSSGHLNEVQGLIPASVDDGGLEAQGLSLVTIRPDPFFVL